MAKTVDIFDADGVYTETNAGQSAAGWAAPATIGAPLQLGNGNTGTAGTVPDSIGSSLLFNQSTTDTIGGNTYVRQIRTVDQMSLTAHGIVLNDSFSERFYNAYNPFNYGGPALVTPEDEGAMLVNFALYPKSYQPSGHLNVSRAREFYVSWQTSYTTASCPAELLVVGVAINFLLITDGSAVLRYST
jgi:hypothetical protein